MLGRGGLLAFAASSMFIIIATISIVEVSGRISAARYLEGKINEIEGNLARGGLQDNEDDVSRSLISLDAYKSTLDELSNLNFAGADQPYQTIIAIRHRISDASIKYDSQLRQQDITDRIQLLQQQAETISEEIKQVQSAVGNDKISEIYALGSERGGAALDAIERARLSIQ